MHTPVYIVCVCVITDLRIKLDLTAIINCHLYSISLMYGVKMVCTVYVYLLNRGYIMGGFVISATNEADIISERIDKNHIQINPFITFLLHDQFLERKYFW